MLTINQLLVCFCVISLVQYAKTHDHFHHGHSHDEAPSFKYSREANEKLKPPEHKTHQHEVPKTVKMDTQTLWLHAMGSTLLISAAPFFILFFVPLDNSDTEKPLLKILLAFASGGLLGDAFLHLIPHATMSSGDGGHSHSHGGHGAHSHEHGGHSHDEEGHVHDMSVGLWVLAGIVTFLIIEKIMRILKGGHGHTHTAPKKADIKSDGKKNSAVTKKTEKGAPQKEIKVAGYLNLAADFSHNFTDGLAIGSSYLAGNTIGIVTTLTILIHEIPHEIGDFAILVQSGVSRRNAMLLQLTTAIGALAGTTISLLAQNNSGAVATTWILPFTAGGFIYIALVSVIPELLDEEKPSFIQTVLQVLAMLSGVALMVLITFIE